MTLGGPLSRSGRCREEISLPLSGFKPWTRSPSLYRLDLRCTAWRAYEWTSRPKSMLGLLEGRDIAPFLPSALLAFVFRSDFDENMTCWIKLRLLFCWASFVCLECRDERQVLLLTSHLPSKGGLLAKERSVGPDRLWKLVVARNIVSLFLSEL
jgi:hypothetical protein